MKLTPKHIIFIAVSNYISTDAISDIKNEISKHKRLSAQRFIDIIQNYFDFDTLRDRPIIPEDIWLYNYLMYDNNIKGNISFVEADKIIIAGRFRITELIRKYEKVVILPQLLAIKQAGKILDIFND
jgi:hypothetical protein